MALHTAPFSEVSAEQKAPLLSFLDAIAQQPPAEINAVVETVDKKVWAEVNCLTCANCCRNMTPRFTTNDIKRIATHFRITTTAFKQKWLEKDKKENWTNRLRPCPFLNVDTNECTIYAIRPDDCAGFPHLTKTPVESYAHMHKQNVSFCPATTSFVQKLMVLFPESSMDI